MESTVAEKFEAMVKLGLLNSRMKDFYDIWFLSRTFDFKGSTLVKAIEKTFKTRKTPLPDRPTIFKPSFMADKNKQAQWLGFINKAKLGDAPESFENLVAGIKTFLQPAVSSIIDRQSFRGLWAASGPWRM